MGGNGEMGEMGRQREKRETVVGVSAVMQHLRPPTWATQEEAEIWSHANGRFIADTGASGQRPVVSYIRPNPRSTSSDRVISTRCIEHTSSVIIASAIDLDGMGQIADELNRVIGGACKGRWADTVTAAKMRIVGYLGDVVAESTRLAKVGDKEADDE